MKTPKPATALQQQRWLQQLATLLRAGIALHPALSLLNLQNSTSQQAYWQPVITGIEQGQGFAATLAHQAGFRRSDVQLLSVAEKSGQLDLQIQRLAQGQARRIHLKGQVMSAIRYPLAVLFGALVVTAFLLWRVVPGFADLYQSFGAELPWLTLQIMSLSSLVQWLSLPCLITAAVLFLWARQCWKNRTQFRAYVLRMLWHLPLAGGLSKAYWLGLWHRTLHETLQAGLPLLDALSETASLVAESPLAPAQADVNQAVAQGQRLSDSLTKQATYPPLCAQMIAIGEESGMLVSLLEELAKHFENELESRCTLLLKLLEPALMAGLGILVGIIVMALYLPLFELGNAL
jgi:type II secretory pathway component PulF